MCPPPLVAYINHVEELGGAERSLLDLLTCLDRTRWSPLLIAPGGGELSERARHLAVPTVACPALGRIHRASGMRRWKELTRLVHGGRQIRRALRAARPALVHANSTPAALFLQTSGRRLSSPFFWHQRDLAPLGRTGAFLARRATRIIVTSRALEAHAADFARPGQVVRIPNGVAVGELQSMARTDVPAAAAGTGPLCVSAGQLVPWKGYGRLLDAAELVHETRPNVRFLVLGEDRFGDGAGRAEVWRERVRARGLSDTVDFLGHVADVRPYLAASDVLVHPAYPEPFGRIVVEALAVGVPVICLAGAHGPAEIVRDGLDGVHVEHTARALADAVLELAGSTHRLTQNARDRARAFDRRLMTERCMDLYDRWAAS